MIAALKSGSVGRVVQAASQRNLAIEIVAFERPAKTAKMAAELIGCQVGQIANSLIFESAQDGALLLLLTSGAHRVDLEYVKTQIGQDLLRANPERIRKETGFAIGGVAPLGHLSPIATWIDEALFDYASIWAAGGRAETVFETTARDLERACDAQRFVAIRS